MRVAAPGAEAVKGQPPWVAGAGSPLRHGCLRGRATLPASSGRLDAVLLLHGQGPLSALVPQATKVRRSSSALGLHADLRQHMRTRRHTCVTPVRALGAPEAPAAGSGPERCFGSRHPTCAMRQCQTGKARSQGKAEERG